MKCHLVWMSNRPHTFSEVYYRCLGDALISPGVYFLISLVQSSLKLLVPIPNYYRVVFFVIFDVSIPGIGSTGNRGFLEFTLSVLALPEFA